MNENKLFRDGELDGAGYRLLERWLQAGMDLGNHTFAHRGATGTSVAGTGGGVFWRAGPCSVP